MIFFDVTKAGAARHSSGLSRVSRRLREALGDRAAEATWDARQRTFRTRAGIGPGADDWVLTPEVFSEQERPGIAAFLEARACRTAAIFHDAIPLKHPHITWPQSVARHPSYMKLLARCDRVWAVSRASREELLGLWQWQRAELTPAVEVLPLGADFDAAPRAAASASGTPAHPPRLLCLGIVEPRKNQAFLLQVCEALWAGGVGFELHMIGRPNPHFGAPILRQLEALQRVYPQCLYFHAAAPDSVVARLFASARATVFPTIAEGCGLPLLESLWKGVPCVCSDLPVLRENADGGGCLPVAVGDHDAWRRALQRIVEDDALHGQLRREAMTRPLPTWADAARALAAALV